jgi:uncharacterized protein
MGLYVLMPALFVPTYWPGIHAFALDVQAANQVYPNGNFMQILQFSSHELKFMIPLHEAIFPRTLALMLFGAWIWKSGLLQQLRLHRLKLLMVGVSATAVGIGITFAQTRNLLCDSRLAGEMLSRLGPAVQALGYAALIALAAQRPHLGRLLGAFAPLGRMAFTNYVTQSLIFSWIFMGYGLGEFNRMSMTAAFLLGCAVYIAQMIASAVWLRRFRFGPLEWLWRSLMYGHAQVMRRGPLVT